MSPYDQPVLVMREVDLPGQPRVRRVARWSVLLPGFTAAGIFVVMMAGAATPMTLADARGMLAFLVWNLLPLAAMAGLLIWSSRLGWAGFAVVQLGSIVAAVLTGVALADYWNSDSSTGALVFLFLPLPLWGADAASGLLALAVRWCTRKHHRPTP